MQNINFKVLCTFVCIKIKHVDLSIYIFEPSNLIGFYHFCVVKNIKNFTLKLAYFYVTLLGNLFSYFLKNSQI
jgi:hypothetical protein